MVSQSTLKTLPFPVLGFAARSGTGKTTLLKKIIPLLKQKNYRLGLIKHSHHRIQFDNRGMTKYIFENGFDVVATSSQLSIAEWHQSQAENSLSDAILCYKSLPIDLLLIEGFKQANFPKIELHRHDLNTSLLLDNDPHIIAIATDSPKQLTNISVPVLNLNNINGIISWIDKYIQQSKH